MATVTVTPPSVVKVEVGNKPTNVQSINYGSRTIKGSADLEFGSPNDRDVIAYDSANNNFIFISVSSAITRVDGGSF